MRCLERNKRTFYYATYKDKEYVEVNGHKTGDVRRLFNEPVKMRASISATTSMTSATRGAFSDVSAYGVVLNYDRRIVTENLDCELDETSVLAIYCEPTYNTETCEFNYDHEVIKKVVGLDNITYYIKRVTKNGS